MTRTPKTLIAVFALTSLLTGCVTTDTHPKQPPVEPEAPLKPPEDPNKIAAKQALQEGIDLYTAGDYNGALKRLSGSNEIWTTDVSIQLDALKYMAFSYCVTNRPAQCRAQFEKAVKLDPDFDLAPGEKGHPLWGPVFDKVKKKK